MEKRIKDEQRDISYGELSALSDEFETQLDEHGVIFDDEEDRDEAFFDFVQQYIDGDDDPQINWENAKVRPVRDSKRRQVRDNADDEINYLNECMDWLGDPVALREWIEQNLDTAIGDMWSVDYGDTPNKQRYVKELVKFCMERIHIDGE